MAEMKVVQINAECGRGSTGKISVAISKLLNEKNITNYIFYSGNHRSEYANGIMISNKMDLRFHQILSRLFGDQGFHSYFVTKRFIKHIRKIEPDAILLHNLHGYYLHLGVLFKFLKAYGKPVYWTFHDCWPFTGHCTHFTVEKCNKWISGCNKCAQKKKYPYSWFFDRSKELYQKKKDLFTSIEDLTIITPSEWLAELVKKSFFHKYPIKVINNGINLDVFKPMESNFKTNHNIGEKKIILGVSAVWNFYKGLDILVELYSRLDPEKYQIVLVGTDEKSEPNIPKGIITIRRTQNQRELAEIYSAADVFVNATREENYPTVNMEAIACGTPVVTFNTGGCAEIVSRDSGIALVTNTVDELAEKIEFIIDNNVFSQTDFVSVAKKFDENSSFGKYLELICS